MAKSKEQRLGVGTEAVTQSLAPLKMYLSCLILFRGFNRTMRWRLIEISCNRVTMV